MTQKTQFLSTNYRRSEQRELLALQCDVVKTRRRALPHGEVVV